MSEESLKRLLERIDADEQFRNELLDDPEAALSGVELSQAEREALASNDEDALRRLAGMDAQAFAPMSVGYLCKFSYKSEPGQPQQCAIKSTKWDQVLIGRCRY